MNSKTTPKDFFLHTGAAIALYVSAIALMNIWFAIINKIVPDTLSGFFSVQSIVWPVSVLVVLVPILYVVEWFVVRDTVKMPEKKDIWVRRWRIYTTLFLTAMTMAGDLIVLINVYLNGEVSGRFLWKVLIVFVVSALIFAYYVLSRIGSTQGPIRIWRIILAWTGGVLVIAAVVGGFIIVGSPAQQRALRFDTQRISDLTNIQYQILNYWQTTGALPVSIDVLNEPLSGFTVPVDPETGNRYEYSVIPSVQTDGVKEPSFEVCAVFDASYSAAQSASGNLPVYNSPMIPSGGLAVATGSASWDHSSGRNCFERTINPKLFPPRQAA